MTFTSEKTFNCAPTIIPLIAKDLETQFITEGFTVKCDNQITGDAHVSITKGGMFSAVAGTKTALNISLKAIDNAIHVKAGVGIFGQQALPTAISMLLFWPVLITQVWGIVQQSQLDDHAMELIEKSIQKHNLQETTTCKTGFYCTNCGAKATGNFCSECGAKLN